MRERAETARDRLAQRQIGGCDKGCSPKAHGAVRSLELVCLLADCLAVVSIHYVASCPTLQTQQTLKLPALSRVSQPEQQSCVVWAAEGI